jgi:hypothetical protein
VVGSGGTRQRRGLAEVAQRQDLIGANEDGDNPKGGDKEGKPGAEQQESNRTQEQAKPAP